MLNALVAVTGWPWLSVPAALTTYDSAVSSAQGPTVHEQAAYNQNVAVAINYVHTIVSSSPVLAEGAYHLMLCATVYSGPAGPVAYSWSMNETPVGKAVVSSLT